MHITNEINVKCYDTQIAAQIYLICIFFHFQMKIILNLQNQIVILKILHVTVTEYSFYFLKIKILLIILQNVFFKLRKI
jgi:hypothetical protein